jgi:excisionase family DNA binding protein
MEADYDASLAQWCLEVERLRYEVQRAERRYRAVDPDNRLVARGLEAEWEQSLQNLAAAETELASRKAKRPSLLSAANRETLRSLGDDLQMVWSAATTTDRDRKELLRAVLEEVNIKVERHSSTAHLILRWKGGELTELDIELIRRYQPKLRTDEDTVDLVRRLAKLYPDAVIAGILNRQGRQTATGEQFITNRVCNLRRYWKIPKFDPRSAPADGDLATIEKAADYLGVAPSTVHRWLSEGFIAGEQLTPGAPWRIRLSEELRARFVNDEVDGYVPMINATKLLGVTRQTIVQRIRRGELQAIHLVRGKRKGLRIKVSLSTDTAAQKQIPLSLNQLDSKQ